MRMKKGDRAAGGAAECSMAMACGTVEGGEQAGWRGQRGGSWKWKTVWRNLVEVGKDMVAERRRDEASRRWEAGNGRWKESDLTKTHADPATRVDSIVAETEDVGPV